MSDAERFMQKFADIWAAPDPDRFTELFHPEGTLLHPGMKEPIPASAIPDYIHRIKRGCPDISLAVNRWAAGEGYVLIEWTMGGSLFGRDVRWSGADRFTLRGHSAIEGIAWFDTLPLWAILDPSMEREGTLEEAAERLIAAS